MIIIDYDPTSKIPPIHANDINKKLFISVISFPVDHFYYMSYAYKVSENLVAFRGISNSDRHSVEWEDTESQSAKSPMSTRVSGLRTRAASRKHSHAIGSEYGWCASGQMRIRRAILALSCGVLRYP